LHTPVHCSPNLRPINGGWLPTWYGFRHPDGWTARRFIYRYGYSPPHYSVYDENDCEVGFILGPLDLP